MVDQNNPWKVVEKEEARSQNLKITKWARGWSGKPHRWGWGGRGLKMWKTGELGCAFVRFGLVWLLSYEFGQEFEFEVWWRFWSWSLVNILHFKFGRDFIAEVWLTNDRYNPKAVDEMKALNPWVRFAFGNVLNESALLVPCPHLILFVCDLQCVCGRSSACYFAAI